MFIFSSTAQVRKLRSPGRAATRISDGPGPASLMLNDHFADTNSVFASDISLRDDDSLSEQIVVENTLSGGNVLQELSSADQFAEPLTLLPRKFLADPDNSSYEDLLLQIYGVDAGKLLA